MNLGKIRGIEIRVHFSAILTIGIIGVSAALFYHSLSFNTLPEWEIFLFGVVNGLIVLLSIFMHELMHLITAKLCKFKVSFIEIGIFSNITQMQGELIPIKSEIAIALIAPILNLLLGIILLSIPYIFINLSSFFLVACFYSGFSNLGIAIFNLIPIAPLDGGIILRALKRR